MDTNQTINQVQGGWGTREAVRIIGTITNSDGRHLIAVCFKSKCALESHSFRRLSLEFKHLIGFCWRDDNNFCPINLGCSNWIRVHQFASTEDNVARHLIIIFVQVSTRDGEIYPIDGYCKHKRTHKLHSPPSFFRVMPPPTTALYSSSWVGMEEWLPMSPCDNIPICKGRRRSWEERMNGWHRNNSRWVPVAAEDRQDRHQQWNYHPTVTNLRWQII